MATPTKASSALVALAERKVIDLNVPLSALVQPDGMGGMDITSADDGPAVLVHENYVLIHWPGYALEGISELPAMAREIRAASRFE